MEFAILESQQSPLVSESEKFPYFPIFQIWVNGQFKNQYDGCTNSSDIMKYLQRITSDPLHILTSSIQIHDFIEKFPVSVIITSTSLDENDQVLIRSAASHFIYRVPFAWAKTTDAIYYLNEGEENLLSVIRKYDQTTIHYEKDYFPEKSEFFEWIEENTQPSYYNSFNSSSFKNLAQLGKPILVGFTDFTKKNALDPVHQSFKEVIKTFDRYFSLYMIDIVSDLSFAQSLGFQMQNIPAYSIIVMENNSRFKVYPFPNQASLSPTEIVRLCQSAKESFEPPILKSEATPSSNDDPMKLVGETFQTNLNDTSVNYLVLFLVGTIESRLEAIQLLKKSERAFRKKSQTKNIKLYFIDIELNDIPGLKYPKIEKPSFVYWDIGEKRQPALLPTVNSVRNLVDVIISKIERTRKEGKETFPDL